MPSVDINYWAVLAAAIVNMAVGAVWYSRLLFGQEWAKLIGKKIEDLRGNANQGYMLSAIGALVQAYILAHFVQYTGSATFSEGMVTGFWLWLGFVAVVMAMNTVFAGRSWRLWRIDAGYFLVVLVLNGGLLATLY